jgi:hypothetical protein
VKRRLVVVENEVAGGEEKVGKGKERWVVGFVGWLVDWFAGR